MTSNAYQMSSRATRRRSPSIRTNDLFWRFDMRRLECRRTPRRDARRHGQLNPAMYGPSFYPEMSAEVLATQSRPGDGWGESSPEERCRRSVYIHVKRSLLPPLLTAFDFPDVDASCEARSSPRNRAGARDAQRRVSQRASAANWPSVIARSGDDRATRSGAPARSNSLSGRRRYRRGNRRRTAT